MDNFTQLDDRILWHDGDSTVPASKIDTLKAQFTDILTTQIKQYNQFVAPTEQIKIKEWVLENDFEWNIPEEYQTLDIKEYINNKLTEEVERQGWNDDDPRIMDRVFRVITEVSMYTRFFGLTDVLRVIIYIINTLEEKQIVWGVGRGSSVSSYVLYLIGVHDVDSVEYDLDITDFLKT